MVQVWALLRRTLSLLTECEDHRGRVLKLRLLCGFMVHSLVYGIGFSVCRCRTRALRPTCSSFIQRTPRQHRGLTCGTNIYPQLTQVLRIPWAPLYTKTPVKSIPKALQEPNGFPDRLRKVLQTHFVAKVT